MASGLSAQYKTRFIVLDYLVLDGCESGGSAFGVYIGDRGRDASSFRVCTEETV